ncbi:hypothetical protein DXG01_000426 [Tephrocybe rancida]|nr:hypothetical protein DXG01_000426 [Tephrocybe rancida]
MSGRKRTTKTKTSNKEDYGGMDPALMQALVSKIPPNAVTGRVDLGDIMKYMSEHPDDMETLMASTSTLGLSDGADEDLSGYDYASLARTIRHESFWVLQLEHLGSVDSAGRPIPDEKAHLMKGARHTFMVYCYDDREQFRVTQECEGLPTADVVLQVLRRAIVKPLSPIKPELPWRLMLSIKFTQHVPHLKPFLDSLPKPFHWRLETAEEQNKVKEGIFELNEDGVRKALVAADKFKAAGNAAFTRKDRAGALKAYTSAINALIDVLSMNPGTEDEVRVKTQLAMCHGNRAATHLASGDDMDLKKAVEDGKSAEHWDAKYAKAYIRQATAYQQAGDLESAKDAIARGLLLPELENEKALVDRLIELYTDGKGFSEDEDIFKTWVLDILINDRRSFQRLGKLQGGWRQRLDAHFTKWPKRS